MTTESESTFPGSAVMPIGCNLEIDALLDELELRLMRCGGAVGMHRNVLRRGGLIAFGEQACAIGRCEVRGFWNEHRLNRSPAEVVRRLVDGILARPPRYLAWAIVPLFTELAPSSLSDESIVRLVNWLTEGEPVERVARDAIALTVVVKWFERQPEGVAVGHLATLCDSEVPERARLGFIALAAWLKTPEGLSSRSLDRAYSLCFGAAMRADFDIAMAVGWALRELLLRDGERLIPRFERQLDCLSRHAVRTAVERLPGPTRMRLTKRWLQGRMKGNKGADTAQRHRRKSVE